MIMKVLLLFLAFFLVVKSEKRLWMCGTQGTEELSFDIVRNECPNAINGIGMCCEAHDSTYFDLAFNDFNFM
jgi:hypothetical protein